MGGWWMMNSHVARALRRFLGTAVMMIGGQAYIHGLLYPGPEMPPAGTNLVRVPKADGIHEITDPATIERLTAFVQSLRGPAVRMPRERSHHFGVPTACFHRTEIHPTDDTFVCLQYAQEFMILQAGHDELTYRISPAKGAEFQRLVDYGVAVSAP
jgi:hypothetical protein